MLTIQGIVTRRGKAPTLVAQVVFPRDNLPAAMAHAQAMFAATRKMHPRNPPNGFRILDAHGSEIGCHVIILEPLDPARHRG